MLEFFQDGGWSMYPISVVGLVLLAAAARYAVDREPVRLRLVAVLSLALLAFSAQGLLVDVAQVLWVVADETRVPKANQVSVMLEGFKECTRPVILGLGLWGIGLIFVAIGAYRTGRRELRAAQG